MSADAAEILPRVKNLTVAILLGLLLATPIAILFIATSWWIAR